MRLEVEKKRHSSGDYEKESKMHKRVSSLRQTKEAEKEVRVEEKEVTSVEDVEQVLPPMEPAEPIQSGEDVYKRQI